jgi:hypothetical protein
MTRKTLLALMVLPAVALAQGNSKPPPPAGQPAQDPVRAEKRMRLVRTLGLATALDLDTAQALKLGDTLAKFDDRRKAIHEQAASARDVLRGAASGGKATAAEVDAAIAKLLDARAQMQVVDKEMVQVITKDLSPEQKARAALFLGRFRDQIERHVWMMGPGMHGHGHASGHGRGMMNGQGGRRMDQGQGMRRWDDEDGRYAAQDDGSPFPDEDL